MWSIPFNVFDIYVRNEKTSKFSKILEKVFTYMVTQAEVDANYNMDMWVKECDKGIVSCFEAKVGHKQSILSASLALPDTSIINTFHPN